MGDSTILLNVNREGILLRDAPFHYSPKELKQEYELARNRVEARGEAAVREQAQVLRTKDLPEASRISLANGTGINLEKLQSDPNYMRVLPGDAELLSTWPKHHSEYEPAMCRHLLDLIQMGEFAALGYESPYTIKSPLVRISAYILQSCRQIDIYASEVSIDTLTFVEVRLLPPGSFHANEAASPPTANHSKAAMCQNAYREALSAKEFGPFDPPKAVKAAISKRLGGSATPKTIWKHVETLHVESRQLAEQGKK